MGGIKDGGEVTRMVRLVISYCQMNIRVNNKVLYFNYLKKLFYDAAKH